MVQGFVKWFVIGAGIAAGILVVSLVVRAL